MALSKPQGAPASSQLAVALGDGNTLSLRAVRSRDELSSRSSSQAVVRVTFHIKCKLCIRFDDDLDPVAQALGRDGELMWWSKPPNKKGETVGFFCGYCCKVYCSTVRSVGSNTINTYCTELGSDTARLSKHCNMALVLIHKIIDSGGRRALHFNWDEIEDESLEMTHELETKFKKPGLSIAPKDWYLKNKGPINTEEGHYESVDENNCPIIVMPDAPIMRIEFNEINKAKRIKKLGGTDEHFGPDLLKVRQQALADAVVPGFAGKFMSGNAVDLMQGVVLGVEESTPSGARSSAASASGLSRSFGGASAQAAPAPFVPVPQVIAGMPCITPTKSGQVRAQEDGSASGQGALARRRLSPKVKEEQGVAAKATGAVAKAAGAVPKKGTRGRPKKDLGVEIERIAEQFFEANPTNPVWWGAEAKTQVKHMQNIAKEAETRLKVSEDLVEIDKLGLSLKMLAAIIDIVDEVRQHGSHSEEFRQIFDLCATRNLLPPVVELKMPAHILYARHKQDILATQGSCTWLRRVGATELKKHGVADVEGEQDLLLSERLVFFLKMKSQDEMRVSLKDLFDPERDFDFDGKVGDFCVGLSIALRLDEYTNLTDLIEILGEAMSSLEYNPSDKHSLQSVSALHSWPRGKKIVEDALAYLEKAKGTAVALKPFQDQVEVVGKFIDMIHGKLFAADAVHMRSALEAIKAFIGTT